MLDQLVESRESYGDGARRGGFLLTTLVLVTSLFASGILWSLFAKDFGAGNESFELSTLVAPVAIAPEAPPVSEPEVKEPKTEKISKETNELPTRRENIVRMDESPLVPKDISNVPNVNKERPKGLVRISEGIETDGKSSSSLTRGNPSGSEGSTIGTNQNGKSTIVKEVDTEPPPTLRKPTPEPTQKQEKISLGVINGKAISLPKPAYPPAAVALRLSGDVSVQVTIDESGRIISAKAVSGHPLLRDASEKAAQSAKFNPTTLSKTPVKVTGVIVYKFSLP